MLHAAVPSGHHHTGVNHITPGVNMTCVDVMYQSYASYFPYGQRPATVASPAASADPFKFGGAMKQDPGGMDVGASFSSSHSSSSGASLTSLPPTPAHALGSSTASSVHSGAPSTAQTPPLSGVLQTGNSASSSSSSSTSAAVVTKIEDASSNHHHQSTTGHSPDPHQQQQHRHHHHQQQQHSGQHHQESSHHHHHHSSHHSSKDTHSQDGVGGGGGGGSGGVGSSSTVSTPHNAQYLSTNCVLFTYYAGDVASHVDDHFTRALSAGGGSPTSPTSPSASATSPYHATDGSSATSPKSPSWKGASPMSQRNFPASFWNSNYHAHAQSTLPLTTSHHDPLGSLHSTTSDAYMTSPLHHSMTSLGAGVTAHDPWRYSLTATQTHPSGSPYTAGHNVHDMAASYAASITSASGRFQPHAYGSLLGSSRLGSAMGGPQCDLGKHSMDAAGHWASSRYHHHHTPAESLGAPNLSAHHDPLHSAIAAGGIETTVQEPSKDLYWF